MNTTWGIHVRTAKSVLAVAIAWIMPGCGSNVWLLLSDYERGLLVGGLTVALLNAQEHDDGDSTGEEPGQPVPGKDGVSCWDLNENGHDDVAEDVNGDGVFSVLDCQGRAGDPGTPGADGVDGQDGVDGIDGVDGLNCWDLDGDNAADRDEDINGDGVFDAQDCKGPRGPAGKTGPTGQSGADLFDIFVDDFFTTPDGPLGDMPIVRASITEPTLGRDPNTGTSSIVAYRVVIPQQYRPGNDVAMRLFFHRTGNLAGDCFAFRLDVRRIRGGTDAEAEIGTRWVSLMTDGLTEESFLVVDLPINNTPDRAGLGLYSDLDRRDLLAFELKTHWPDGGWYHLIGVEFFEAYAAGATLSGAAVFTAEPENPCVE